MLAAALLASSLYICGHSQTTISPCPAADASGWGYMAIGISVNDTAISAQWTEYPGASNPMIVACFYMSEHSTKNATIAYHPDVTEHAAAAAAAAADAAAPPPPPTYSCNSSRDGGCHAVPWPGLGDYTSLAGCLKFGECEAAPPPAAAFPGACTQNRFPKKPWAMRANESCRELPPFCSASLGISFDFNISSPGVPGIQIHISCDGGPAGNKTSGRLGVAPGH